MAGIGVELSGVGMGARVGESVVGAGMVAGRVEGVELEQAATSTANIDRKSIKTHRRLVFLWLLSFGRILKMIICFFTCRNLMMDVSLKADVLDARLIRWLGGQIRVYHRASFAETTTGVGTGQPATRWLYWCPIG